MLFFRITGFASFLTVYRGKSKSVQVLFNGIDAVAVITDFDDAEIASPASGFSSVSQMQGLGWYCHEQASIQAKTQRISCLILR